jgi:hypothetical protein
MSWKLTNLSILNKWESVASNSSGQTLLAASGSEYIGVDNSGGGIYFSTDGGLNWPPTALAVNEYTNYDWRSVASNSSGQTLLASATAGGTSVGGIYFSTDGGLNWSPTALAVNEYTNYDWNSVASNSSGQTLLAAAAVSGIYVSTDGGLNWPPNTLNMNQYTNYRWNSVASNSDGQTLLSSSRPLLQEQQLFGGVWIYNKNFVCFKQDAKILTDKGYIKIQDLHPGDLVKTVSNGFKPIHSIGKRNIYHPASSERIKDQLYLCTKEHYPKLFEDLVITGCHSILVPQYKDDAEREKTIEVYGNTYVTEGYYRLPSCADERASVYSESGDYTIYHFALENNDNYMNYGVYANGLLVETCSKRYLNELAGMELIV